MIWCSLRQCCRKLLCLWWMFLVTVSSPVFCYQIILVSKYVSLPLLTVNFFDGFSFKLKTLRCAIKGAKISYQFNAVKILKKTNSNIGVIWLFCIAKVLRRIILTFLKLTNQLKLDFFKNFRPNVGKLEARWKTIKTRLLLLTSEK